MEQTAQIAVEGTAFHFDRLFDYRVPPEFVGKVTPGVRVLVPFGRGNRKIQGLVFQVSPVAQPDLKPVLGVLDAEPVIDGEGFRIIEFLAETTFCSYYDAMKCLLPAGLDGVLQEEFRLKRAPDAEEESRLSKEEQEVLAAVSEAESQKEVNRYFSEGDTVSRKKAARRLTEMGIFCCSNQVKAKGRAKTVRMVALAEERPQISLTAKQRKWSGFWKPQGPWGKRTPLIGRASGKGF